MYFFFKHLLIFFKVVDVRKFVLTSKQFHERTENHHKLPPAALVLSKEDLEDLLFEKPAIKITFDNKFNSK